MKKIIPAFIIIVVIAFISIYLFFPATQKRAISFGLGVNQKALHRALLQQTVVYKKQKSNSAAKQIADVGTLQLYPGAYEDFIINTQEAEKTNTSQLKLLSLGTDSTLLYWNAIIKSKGTPWQRIHTYLQARHLQNEVKNFLYSLQSFKETENLYGIKVLREKVRDTAMVATRFATAAYPQTEEIYHHIHLLQQYINTQGATVTNHPMMHVRPAGKGYETMVALPTSKALTGNGSIELKRMIMGNILMAEVKGGPSAVTAGMQQLEKYVSDHALVSPAIPFASLITDRSKEPDSSKWITKLYYPIF